LDVATFTRRVDAWIAAHDATAAEQHFEAVRARRYLRLSDRDGGTSLSGFVDPLVGACLRTCLEAVTPVPGTGDQRTGEQRTADALALIATRILDAGTDKIGAQIRPHISLIVPADTWATTRRRTNTTNPDPNAAGHDAADPDRGTTAPAPGATASNGPGDGPGQAAGDGPTAVVNDGPGAVVSDGPTAVVNDEPGATAGDGPTAVVNDGPGETSLSTTSITDPTVAGQHAGPVPTGAEPLTLPELDDGTVIPISELERIACDCELTRIVLDADGIPLDVGQTERTYSKSLRRAVLVRDGHCRWPGCTMRASWCEVHHVTWYSNGGATSAANALSLCAFHHHEVHRTHLRITPTPRGHTFTRPDGRLIGTTTRDTGILRMLTPRRGTDDRPDDGPDRELRRQKTTPRGAGTGAGAPAGSGSPVPAAEDGGTSADAGARGSAAPPDRGPGGEPPPTGELF
ncbi:MAG TPA: DUF222 domain-containing protein, partial [Actinotalea sp.]|nr:DUF222 domain-containing protein [Actinotalea sp.]